MKKIPGRGKILMAATCAILAGCTSDFGPWPFPAGYTYHNEQYRAPPGPEPVLKKWEMEREEKKRTAPLPKFTEAKSPAQPSLTGMHSSPATSPQEPNAGDPQLWLSAAEDLTGRMFGKSGRPAETVYISPPQADEDSQYFAAALNAALQEQGIAVEKRQDNAAITLRYAATGIGADNEERLLLTITMLRGAEKFAETSGIYTVRNPDASISQGGKTVPTLLTAPGAEP